MVEDRRVIKHEVSKRFILGVNEFGDECLIDNPEYVKQSKEELYKILLSKSKIPSFYHNIDFEDYHGDKSSTSFVQIKNYAENGNDKKYDNISLYLFGNNGSQKTAMACNIGKAYMRSGFRVKFILAGELIDKLLKLQGYNTDTEIVEEINDLKSQDLLIIDDCWDEQKSLMWKNNSSIIIVEWDKFFRGVLGNGLKVVMTSNFPLEVVRDCYGESLYQLLDRNVYPIPLYDCVREVRKLDVRKAFEGVF